MYKGNCCRRFIFKPEIISNNKISGLLIPGLFPKSILLTFMIVFLFTIFFNNGALFSQNNVPNEDDIRAFFRTKTLVVLESNPLLEYNSKITEAVKDNWNITEFDFISFEEFEQERNNSQYSFLLTTTVSFEKDKTNAIYIFLQLLAGGRYLTINDMPHLASIPLSYKNADELNHVYKLSLIVRFIQNHMLLLKYSPSIAFDNYLAYYNRNMDDIRTKILYVVKEELAPEVNTIEKIKNYYPYRVKIVAREDIEEAIYRKDPDVVFLHKVGPEDTKLQARCYKIIIGAANAKFYYFDYHMVTNKSPDGLLISDFKKMAK